MQTIFLMYSFKDLLIIGVKPYKKSLRSRGWRQNQIKDRHKFNCWSSLLDCLLPVFTMGVQHFIDCLKPIITPAILKFDSMPRRLQDHIPIRKIKKLAGLTITRVLKNGNRKAKFVCCINALMWKGKFYDPHVRRMCEWCKLYMQLCNGCFCKLTELWRIDL